MEVIVELWLAAKLKGKEGKEREEDGKEVGRERGREKQGGGEAA